MLSFLELQNVSFADSEKPILKDVSVNVDANDFISIIGPSGSGKSTFLKLCSHLISPTSGDIMFKDKDFNEYNPTDIRRNIAYCFQTPYLFGDTVMENINFPFFIRNVKPDQKRVNDLFSMFHMTTEFLNKDTKTLSGGERQRIALIRSLLFKPEVLLLDEITSALDVENAEIVENGIASLNNEGVTVLWVTHDLEQSRRYANKLLTMESGEIRSLEVLK